MAVLRRSWGFLHWRADGPEEGPVLLLLNSLGTDARLWDDLLPRLPPALRVLRMDKPGHGLSDGAAAATVESLAADAAALLDHLGGRPAAVLGLSIGGLIGQALALARPDLVAALILSNTGAKIGTAEVWAERLAAVERGGVAAIADGVMERWFSPAFRADPGRVAPWRNMLLRTTDAGWLACGRAVAAADLRPRAAAIRVPTLALGGGADAATPPALLEELAALIPGARLAILPGVGHLPHAEAPGAYAAEVAGFLAGRLGPAA
jgi:3-oxoadipate enol-lactonase